MPFEVEPIEDTKKETFTTCPYCGVGCGVIATPSEDGQSAKIEGDPDHPSNFGKLCSKGSALGETLTYEERLLDPIVHGMKSDWNSALDLVAGRFLQTIAEHGPDSVAFYVSGQCLTEDYYVANKLMKGFIGSSNIDTNSRLCMASSVAGHKRAFGTDTVPGCYEDLDQSDLVVLVGSNFAWCHPVLHQRLLRAKEECGTKIVVIDPRKTATTEAADLHLAIKPGADVALFNALFVHLANSDAKNSEYVDEYTDGLADALAIAEPDSLQKVVAQTGLSRADITTFFEWVTDTQKTMTIYSQGVNQSSSGTDKVNAIINTHLVTGRIGRPGMGPFSITGQPNAMGGREVGGLANQLAVHMDFDQASLDKVERFWSAPNLTKGPGLKAVDMFDAIANGKVKALWVMATNPAVSMPNADKVRKAIENCPFVVVSDVVQTSDTVELAHVKLPATGWGEKTGTVTNSERRISRQRSFLKPAGQARHDWDVLCDVAKRMGFSGFNFESPAEIFKEYAQMSAFENNGSRDFDIGSLGDITDAEYEVLTPFQWPAPKFESKSSAPKRFFADGQFYTPNSKARFIATRVREPATATNPVYDLVLNTGRIRDHWHTMTRTGKTQRLSTHIGEPFIEINPMDANKLGLADADIAVVKSLWGSSHLRVVVTERMERGAAFAPIHWTRRFSSKGCIDEITSSNHDPVSGQPELKFTPISIRKMRLDWWAFVLLESEPDRQLLQKASYWALARRGDGWSIELAGESSECEADVFVDEICQSVVSQDELIYKDTKTGNYRKSVLNNSRLVGFATTSKVGPVEADRVWLGQNIGKDLDPSIRLSLLAGRPPAGEATGKIICSCMGIGAGAIEKAIKAGDLSVEAVGKSTCAGTNCGSCKPEISALISNFLNAEQENKMEAAE